MIEVATASINNFASGKADFVQPSEQLITLTFGQLQDLIQEATERAIEPLEARLETLEERGVGCGKGGEVPQDGQKGLDQILKVVSGLRAENAALKRELENLQEITARERAADRRRIAALEKPPQESTEGEKARLERIERYLKEAPDHRISLAELRGRLGI